jgi:hypothetical protein
MTTEIKQEGPWTEEKFIKCQIDIFKSEMKGSTDRKQTLINEIRARQQELDEIESREKNESSEQYLDNMAKSRFEQQLEKSQSKFLTISIPDCVRILNEIQDFKCDDAVQILHPRTHSFSGLFGHPDNIRYLFEKEGKPVPEWYAEKYSSAFEKAEPKQASNFYF